MSTIFNGGVYGIALNTCNLKKIIIIFLSISNLRKKQPIVKFVKRKIHDCKPIFYEK